MVPCNTTVQYRHLDDDGHDGVDDCHGSRHDRRRYRSRRLGQPSHGLQMGGEPRGEVVGQGREDDNGRPCRHLNAVERQQLVKEYFF